MSSQEKVPQEHPEPLPRPLDKLAFEVQQGIGHVRGLVHMVHDAVDEDENDVRGCMKLLDEILYRLLKDATDLEEGLVRQKEGQP
jgi:hypothetical protein